MIVEVLRATSKMADDMGYVHAMSWQKAYKDIIPKEILNKFTPENRAIIFKEAIATRPEEFYLFKVENKPAGIALLHKRHEDQAADVDGEIYAFYFHPDYWGHDCTHSAFQYCIDRLIEIGFQTISIWVLEENYRARRFYEKFGFSYDGSQKKSI